MGFRGGRHTRDRDAGQAHPAQFRERISHAVPQQLSSESREEDNDKEDFSGEESGENLEGICHVFRDETWNQNNFIYDPTPLPFTGQKGWTTYCRYLPTFLYLWEIFWPFSRLCSIVRESNRYATTNMGDGKTMGGRMWTDLTVPELKCFIAILLYMGMKRQPSLRSYWAKKGSTFYCPMISTLMMCRCFESTMCCLHITDSAIYDAIPRGTLGFDKIRQIWWLVEEVRDRCKAIWLVGKYILVDKMIIWYKGTYALIWQYMPNKPQKWGFKVWCFADAASKFVWNFSIYCGKSNNKGVVPPMARGEPTLAHNVVLKLAEGLENKGHVIVMDNFFSSVGLFMDLKARGIYATCTMRSNRIGLPLELKNSRRFRRAPQGTLDWCMHESWGICCVLWKDKEPILSISTHSTPILAPFYVVDIVPRRKGAIREFIPTSRCT